MKKASRKMRLGKETLHRLEGVSGGLGSSPTYVYTQTTSQVPVEAQPPLHDSSAKPDPWFLVPVVIVGSLLFCTS